MALTVGTGPFGRAPAGEFNVAYDAPAHVLYLEDSPRRVRVVVAGETVAQSSRARLLHETGLAPVYYLPEADVRAELLEPSERTTHCPFKGDASYWTIRVGDVRRPDAVWSYPEPLPEAPPLAGYLAFRWDAIDEWWEEAERIGVHPRDPYHRCDAIRSDRHVVVRVGGEVVADSRRPTVLFETGLPPRFYLPLDDVELDRLERTGTETSCPYKGTTSRYYTVDPAGQRPRTWRGATTSRVPRSPGTPDRSPPPTRRSHSRGRASPRTARHHALPNDRGRDARAVVFPRVDGPQLPGRRSTRHAWAPSSVKPPEV
jgi:uncharacterized protein (DUF427 family)